MFNILITYGILIVISSVILTFIVLLITISFSLFLYYKHIGIYGRI